MKAIILAAGRGSRLQQFTDDKPKCLNYIGGEPILARQISVLRSCGISDITIVTGYRAGMLRDFGAKTVHNPAWEKTNMLRSLLCAREEFGHTVIVSYSDIVYGREAVDNLIRQENDAVVVYDLDWKELWKARFKDPLEDAESFKIDSDNRIREIGQRAGSIDEIQGQYTGLMRFSPLAFGWIKDFTHRLEERALDRMDMTSLLQRLIKQGHPIYGMAIKGGWCEIDTKTDFELANRLYSKGSIQFV